MMDGICRAGIDRVSAWAKCLIHWNAKTVQYFESVASDVLRDGVQMCAEPLFAGASGHTSGHIISDLLFLRELQRHIGLSIRCAFPVAVTTKTFVHFQGRRGGEQPGTVSRLELGSDCQSIRRTF